MTVTFVMRFALGASLAFLAVSCASTEATSPQVASVPPRAPPESLGATSAQSTLAPTAIEIGASVRYVVQLGHMRNGSGLGREDLARVLHDSARVRASVLKDVAVIDANPTLAKQAAERHIPVITLDGLVTQLTESPSASGLEVRATVEFALRRDEVLRATVSGAATAAASSPSISDRSRRQLQEEAIDGAVQSALLAADRGFTVAAR